MITGELMARMQRLLADRVPFVTATVVRAAKPTSVRPGDSALVLADGTIDGFVGGACAQASVRLYAARALETGEAVLLRLLPGDAAGELPPGGAVPLRPLPGDAEGDAAPGEPVPLRPLPVGADGEAAAGEGVVVAHNPCLSGGALEVFLEPQLAAPRIVVAGDTPIARALEAVARAAGYDVLRGDAVTARDAAFVAASHGEGEEAALARALEAGVSYVGLVASRRRGRALVGSLDVPDALRAVVHTPAGLDIGARAPGDVAISILAEIVSCRTAHAPAPRTAVDPVCGMEVAATDATLHADVAGTRVYFCCEGCRSAHLARA